MLYGHVRDQMPRALLTLPGSSGPFSVKLRLDTGFEGELTLPSAFAARLELEGVEARTVAMADGTMRSAFVGYITLEWNEQPRPIEEIVLDGNPLLRMLLLDGSQIQIEATDGGEVVIEAL